MKKTTFIKAGAMSLLVGGLMAFGLSSCEKDSVKNTDQKQSVKATWESCNNWAGWQTGKYYYRNNIWGSGNPGASWQCTWANSASNWGVSAGHSNNTGSVKGYPQMIVGWASGNGFGLNSDRGNMGKQHQAYSTLNVYWNFSAPASPARYLSLIDLYFHWTGNPAGNTYPRTNIQLMTHWNDPTGWFDNSGTSSMTYKGERTIDGITYRAYYKSPHPDGAAENLIQIRPTTKRTNATHNIKAIAAWCVSMGIMSNSEYMTSIQAGWEIIDGNNGAGFQTNGYSVTANN